MKIGRVVSMVIPLEPCARLSGALQHPLVLTALTSVIRSYSAPLQIYSFFCGYQEGQSAARQPYCNIAPGEIDEG